MLDISLKTTWVVYPLINIEANPSHDSESPLGDEQIELKQLLEYDESDSTLRLHFSLAMPERQDQNLEYFINVKLFATFAISKDLRKVKRETAKEVVKDIAILAVGAVREIVATTTSRGPWGTYILPFLDIEDIADSLLNDVLDVPAPVKKRKKPQA